MKCPYWQNKKCQRIDSGRQTYSRVIEQICRIRKNDPGVTIPLNPTKTAYEHQKVALVIKDTQGCAMECNTVFEYDVPTGTAINLDNPEIFVTMVRKTLISEWSGR